MPETDSLRQIAQSRAPFSTWLGTILLFVIFGAIVLAVIGPSPRKDTYEATRAKKRVDNLNALRTEDAKALTTYAWVDKAKGTVRIPIDRAMQVTVAELAKKASLGAKSNGTTDDSAALNAAIAAIIASPTGGIILIPSGRTLIAWAITASIPAGVALTIQGLGSRIPNSISLTLARPEFSLLNSGGTSGAWGRVNLNSFTLTRGPASPPIASAGISIQADPTVRALCGVGGSFRDLAIIGSSLGSTGWANSFILQGGGGCSFDNVYIRGVNAGSLGDLGDALLNVTGTLVGGTFKQFATNNNIVNCPVQGGSVGLLVSGYAQGVAVSNSTIIGQYDSVRWIRRGLS